MLSLTRSKAVLSEKMWVRSFLYAAIWSHEDCPGFNSLLVQYYQHKHRLHVKMPTILFTIMSTHTTIATRTWPELISGCAKSEEKLCKLWENSRTRDWKVFHLFSAGVRLRENSRKRSLNACVCISVVCRRCGSLKNFIFLSVSTRKKNASLHGNLHHNNCILHFLWVAGVRKVSNVIKDEIN
jgi:hypothetical protein